MATNTFGPYESLELIGTGGMGQVYKAIDSRRGRIVALKVLNPELSQEDDYRHRFILESRLAARLTNPHVIPIHDWGELDGRLFIEMRYVEGHDLARTLTETGPLTPQDTAQLVTQVASALDSAHTDDLVHRDVKPSNVLLYAAEWEPVGYFAYLIDFGIARSLAGFGSTRVTGTGQFIGSLGYMAPERLKGHAGDARSDIYSLGATMYEMLCGTPPFGIDPDIQIAVHGHLYMQPPSPSSEQTGVPASLDGVIARALAKRPEDRYDSAGALARAATLAVTSIVDVTSRRVSAAEPSTQRDVAASEDSRISAPPRPSSQVTDVEVGTRPVGVALTLDGHVAVISEQPPKLSLIDSQSGAIRRSVPLPLVPSDVAMSRDGTRMYIVSTFEDKLMSIETIYLTLEPSAREKEVERRRNSSTAGLDGCPDSEIGFFSTDIRVGTGPASVAPSPDGRWVYVSNINSDNVERIDANELQIRYGLRSDDYFGLYGYRSDRAFARAGYGAAPVRLVVSPEGESLYTANRDANTVSTIRSSNFSSDIFRRGDSPSWTQIEGSPRDIVLSHNRRHLYIATTEPSTLTIIQAIGRETVRVLELNSMPSRLALSSDGRRVYISHEEEDRVAVVHVAGEQARVEAIADVGPGPTAVAATRDNAYVYVANTGGQTVSRVLVR